MTIILVEIVRITLDAFWSEKSTICQRNISPLAPQVCAGGERSRDWGLKWPTSMLKKS